MAARSFCVSLILFFSCLELCLSLSWKVEPSISADPVELPRNVLEDVKHWTDILGDLELKRDQSRLERQKSNHYHVLSAPTQVASLLSIRRSMEFLYNATNGQNWFRQYNFSSADPCSSRLAQDRTTAPVYCYIFGGVQYVRLNLNANNLVGTLPAELFLMDSLSDVYLDQNVLSGTIPAVVNPNLYSFSLMLNNGDITGTIPAQWFDQLFDISIGPAKLRAPFYTNLLRPGCALGALVGFRTNVAEDITAVFAAPPASLSSLFVDDEPFLTGDVSRMGITRRFSTDTFSFKSVPGLTGSFPNISSAFTPFLSSMRIQGLPRVELSLQNEFAHNPSALSVLIIRTIGSSRGVFPMSLCNLTLISSIAMEGIMIAGSVPDGCFLRSSRLVSLEFLSLTSLSVNLGSVLRSSANPFFNVLQISNSKVVGGLPEDIFRMRSIVFISISRSALSGGFPNVTNQCPTLVTINVASNDLNGSIPSQFLSYFPALEAFLASSNALSGSLVRVGIALHCFFYFLHLFPNCSVASQDLFVCVVTLAGADVLWCRSVETSLAGPFQKPVIGQSSTAFFPSEVS